MPIAKIHLLTVATTRRAWLQILSVRISDQPLKLSKNKYPKYFLWYWDSYKPFYNIILKIASRCEKNLITLSILQNKSFKKYRQVFFYKYLKVLADRICKTFFSSLLQALGVFLRSARDLVVWKWLHCGLVWLAHWRLMIGTPLTLNILKIRETFLDWPSC